MNKRRNKKKVTRLLIIGAAIVFLYTLHLFPYKPSFAADEKPALSVNGEAVLEAEVQMAIDRLIPFGAFHGRITPEKRETFRQPAIDSVIENTLLYQEGKRLGLEIKKSEIKEIFEKNKASFKKEKYFYDALEKQGLTEESYKKIIEKELFSKKALKQEVEDKVKLSDTDLEKYYNENKQKFLSPEKIRLREISVSVPPNASEEERKEKKKKAEDLLGKAKAGKDFSELAYNFSEDAYKVKSGDLGSVHRGRLEPAIENAAFKLNVGEISGLIETIYGYHIIKLEGKEPQKQLEFSEAKDSMKKDLETRRYKDAKEILIKRLKEKAKIEF